jgi:hypothetical protein
MSCFVSEVECAAKDSGTTRVEIKSRSGSSVANMGGYDMGLGDTSLALRVEERERGAGMCLLPAFTTATRPCKLGPPLNHQHHPSLRAEGCGLRTAATGASHAYVERLFLRWKIKYRNSARLICFTQPGRQRLLVTTHYAVLGPAYLSQLLTRLDCSCVHAVIWDSATYIQMRSRTRDVQTYLQLLPRYPREAQAFSPAPFRSARLVPRLSRRRAGRAKSPLSPRCGRLHDLHLSSAHHPQSHLQHTPPILRASTSPAASTPFLPAALALPMETPSR